MAQQETGRWQRHPPQSLHFQPASPWLWVSVIAASLPLTCCGLSVRTIFPNPAKPHLDDGNSGRRGGKSSPRKACRPHPLATDRTQPTTPTPTLSTHIICVRWVCVCGGLHLLTQVPTSWNAGGPPQLPKKCLLGEGAGALRPLALCFPCSTPPKARKWELVPATPKTQEASAQPVHPERGVGAAEEDGYWQPPG